MAQFFDFISNNIVLVCVWMALLTLIIMNESARSGKNLTTIEVTHLINKKNAVVLDIRSFDDFKSGSLPSAINIPSKDLNTRFKELNKYKQTPIIVVCKAGQTAGGAVQTLTKNGFEQVSRMRGGIMEWTGNKLPLVKS